jgi:xanthine dehydrogenase accessory factor
MPGSRTSLEPAPVVAARWLQAGRRVVAATLVAADGSSPLDPGATMLVDDRGAIEGSVTGGCVEGALVEEAQEVLAGGGPRLRTYGISDSQAAGVGLMCGGTVHILVSEIPPAGAGLVGEVRDAVQGGRPAALATLVDGPGAGAVMAVVGSEPIGTLGLGGRLDRAVERDALGCLAHGVSALRGYGAEGEVMGIGTRVFIRAFAAPARMVIFGAIDFSAAVAGLARTLGYAVTICDARRPFTQAARFAVADEVVVDWPDRYLAGVELTERDVVLVFTHDPKFDEPALVGALASGAGYIGALGSRQTHEDRVRRLLAAGVGEADLERIASPCGLDIGARTPEEAAVSVVAEILARTAGRSGRPLSETAGRIHADRPVPAELG